MIRDYIYKGTSRATGPLELVIQNNDKRYLRPVSGSRKIKVKS